MLVLSWVQTIFLQLKPKEISLALCLALNGLRAIIRDSCCSYEFTTFNFQWILVIIYLFILFSSKKITQDKRDNQTEPSFTKYIDY